MNEKKPCVSVVLPCLNEEEAVGICIKKIQEVFLRHHINGEIIVSDNGSTDSSVKIAQALGVHIVHESKRGYGNAYLKGFSVAQGEYIIMADCDDTYDFNEIPNFLNKLINEKYDFVSGSRYLGVSNQGIPFLHRYIGNPFLTAVLNMLFGLQYTDVYTGFRGFSQRAYHLIKPVSQGMEFNLELAINAKLAGLNVAEIPITLGQRKGVSKLRTFEDGWRSLRMMLIYCPNKVFIDVGIALFAFGVVAHLIALSGFVRVGIGGQPLSAGTGIFAFIFSVVGFETIALGFYLKTFSWSNRFDKQDYQVNFFDKYFNMEIGLIVGALMAILGSVMLTVIIIQWLQSKMLPLPHLELVTFAGSLVVIGLNSIFFSLFIASMTVNKKT